MSPKNQSLEFAPSPFDIYNRFIAGHFESTPDLITQMVLFEKHGLIQLKKDKRENVKCIILVDFNPEQARQVLFAFLQESLLSRWLFALKAKRMIQTRASGV